MGLDVFIDLVGDADPTRRMSGHEGTRTRMDSNVEVNGVPGKRRVIDIKACIDDFDSDRDFDSDSDRDRPCHGEIDGLRLLWWAVPPYAFKRPVLMRAFPQEPTL